LNDGQRPTAGTAEPAFDRLRYSDLTVNDRNALKRGLQRKRLAHGLSAVADLPADFGGRLLDFGCGDGELAKLLRARFPAAEIACYEPAPSFRQQAAENLAGLAGVELTADTATLSADSFDVIFCLEVLEHLPERETEALLSEVERLLSRRGRFVVGVPNELHFSALVRGLFRRLRGRRDFDTMPRNILAAVFGRPPRSRPASEIVPGSFYYRRHMGFDHRALGQVLESHFRVQRTYGSPAPWLPLGLNFEVYLVCSPKDVPPESRSRAKQ
jgi:2-polyprenyl-3-methyl-5-hydroxy-6-metoxy-1,4-benzoquinol methylase